MMVPPKIHTRLYAIGSMREMALNATSDIKIGRWWDWLLKIIVPAGLLFVAIYGGFMKDIPAPYGDYPVWAASMIWVILFVTLVLSFVFQRIKSRTPEVKKEEE